NDELHTRRSLDAKLLPDLLDVIVKQSDQIGRAQHHCPLPCLERQAPHIQRIMHRGGDAVVSEPGRETGFPESSGVITDLAAPARIAHVPGRASRSTKRYPQTSSFLDTGN